MLIPVFALGRAQELCLLIDTYWERLNINVPIYFSAGEFLQTIEERRKGGGGLETDKDRARGTLCLSLLYECFSKRAGLTEKANHYYKLFINWTNEKIKDTFIQRFVLCVCLVRLCVSCECVCVPCKWKRSVSQPSLSHSLALFFCVGTCLISSMSSLLIVRLLMLLVPWCSLQVQECFMPVSPKK